MEGPGLYLVGGWGAQGPLLVVLGRLLLVIWAFKIQLFLTWDQNGAKKGSKRAPGWIWGPFWEGLGRFGEGSWTHVSHFLANFRIFGRISPDSRQVGGTGRKATSIYTL